MSGSLQGRIYGNHKHSTTLFKKAGHYNGAVKKLGHYNGAPKKLGHYNGAGASKNNLNMEMYPHY
jgi:hypothetical protein